MGRFFFWIILVPRMLNNWQKRRDLGMNESMNESMKDSRIKCANTYKGCPHPIVALMTNEL
jgi:hypothetical protein